MHNPSLRSGHEAQRVQNTIELRLTFLHFPQVITDGSYWYRAFAMTSCAVQSLDQQASPRADVEKRRERRDPYDRINA